MGWKEAADNIEQALAKAILSKKVTVDFYNLMTDATLLKTSEFATEIISHLHKN
jgi:isocitrate dehydrogenase